MRADAKWGILIAAVIVVSAVAYFFLTREPSPPPGEPAEGPDAETGQPSRIEPVLALPGEDRPPPAMREPEPEEPVRTLPAEEEPAATLVQTYPPPKPLPSEEPPPSPAGEAPLPEPPSPPNEPAPEPSEPATSAQYTVREGDALWDIVKAHYGRVSPSLVRKVATHNRLADENDIHPGDVLKLPPEQAIRQEEPEPSAPAQEWYTVQPGETLITIAEKIYGDENEWERLLLANRKLLRDNQRNLKAGMRIRVPKPPSGRPPKDYEK